MKRNRFLFIIAALALLCTPALADDNKDSITITQIDPTDSGSPKKTPKIVAQIDDSSSENKAIISKSFGEAAKIKEDERMHVGQHASYIQIDIKHDNHTITIASLHSLYESKLPGLVATAEDPGLAELEGRKLEDVIKSQPQSYQNFRQTFDSIYAQITTTAKPGRN